MSFFYCSHDPTNFTELQKEPSASEGKAEECQSIYQGSRKRVWVAILARFQSSRDIEKPRPQPKRFSLEVKEAALLMVLEPIGGNVVPTSLP